MHIVKIPKKTKGEFRTIYVPTFEEKAAFRSIVGQLQQKAEKFCPEGVAQGFMRGRSAVSNAGAHVGLAYTTCMDLKDFFDSVTARQLIGKLTTEELEIVLVDGAARQGLPTSPSVANIAAADMDKAILRWRKKHKLQFVYTRYADDLSFSYDDLSTRDALLSEIPQIVRRCGFQVNESKTRTMSAHSGRRVITGVAVDADIHPTRRLKRRLRAALHQGNDNEADGLAEWCKLKPPRQKIDRTTYDADDLRNLGAAWRLPRIAVPKLPKKRPAEDLGDNCIVTPDPVYMLGMSNWTTGWTSCMKHPGGSNHKGVLFWTFLAGSRIATYLSDKTMVVANVERKRMRARALVHELRSGAKVYDKIYGNPGDTEHLRFRLEEAGYMSIPDARTAFRNGVEVVGHAPARWMAHLDNLKSKTSTANAGPWRGKTVRIVQL